MADFDKNMILPHVPCGHFALSTLSETRLKDAVFEINVTSTFHKEKQKSKTSILTPKSKVVSYLDIIWSHLTHFDIRQIPKSQLCHQRADVFLVVL